ncbi:MAG: tetratricopeptide repeat protein [Chlamydiales bacterium]|nr:tetratricopeptide repeat protein [Chlamydiales bacterium]
MRRDYLLVCLLALSAPLLPSLKPIKNTSPQEALQLRRIAEFWKEGDYQAAKMQILDLLSKKPDTNAREQLYTMLGDLYFFDNKHAEAVDAYAKVTDADLKKKSQLNYLRSLFSLNRYPDVIKETARELNEAGGDRFELHYLLAESLWRQGMQTKDEEKKLRILEKAKQEYRILEKTSFKEASLLPMAYIHREMKESAEAAALFLQLAQKYPDKKEELLFQAACLQVQTNKEEACKTFASVYQLAGKKAKAAAFNQLLLLFQMEKYSELITAQEIARKYLAQEKLPLVQFYIGKSHFALKNYKLAVVPLQMFLADKQASSSEVKSALLCLINCAKETRDLSLMENSVKKMGELFPEDLDYAKTLVLHAQVAEELGDVAAAREQIQRVLVAFPNHEEKEALSFEQCRLLVKAQQWEQGRAAFSDFLQTFSSSAQAASAWHQLVHAALMERKNAKEEQLGAKNEMLVSVLKEALSKDQVWKQEEKESYVFLMGKTLYSMGRWEESAKSLETFLQAFATSSSSAEAHLLVALALHRAGTEGMNFLTHAEQALSLNPNLENRSVLRLMLYNAYLKEAGQRQGDKDLIEKAADHLYACAMQNDVEVKRDNLLWLANYYYGRAKADKGGNYSARATQLFERILKELKAITADTLFLEGEALKYAELLTLVDNYQGAIALLGDLKSIYEAKPDLSWKFQRRALLDLGRAYAHVKETERAVATYDYLINTSSHTLSTAADTALLERARLEYGLLQKEEKSDANPRLSSILAALKDLQIKKRLTSEPIHLEAALDYALIKSELVPQEKRLEKLLALLKSAKEEFLSEEDPDAQEYQACRLRQSDKDQLFVTYMKFIDSLILQTQAALTENEEEAKEMKLKADALLEELKNSNSELTPYLRDKLEKTTSL